MGPEGGEARDTTSNEERHNAGRHTPILTVTYMYMYMYNNMYMLQTGIVVTGKAVKLKTDTSGTRDVETRNTQSQKTAKPSKSSSRRLPGD